MILLQLWRAKSAVTNHHHRQGDASLPSNRRNSNPGKGIVPKKAQKVKRPKSAGARQKAAGSGIPFRHVSLIIILGSIALLASYSSRRYLDQDELEHLNSAYFISRGETIYGSFFENHPPLTAMMLQPVVRFCETPAAMIRWGRRLMFGLALATLLGAAWLASSVGGRQTAAFAVIWLLGNTYFISKSLEVRPDAPAQLCMVFALVVLLRAASSPDPWWKLAGGALMATAGLFTPKVIFAAAGASIGFCLSASGSGPGARLKEGLGRFALLAAGAAVPAAIAVAELARRGLLAGFISDVLATSWHMKIDELETIRWFSLKSTATVNAASWIIAAVGIVILVHKRRQLSPGSVPIITGSMAGGILGLFLIAAPLRQYYLTFLASFAVAGGAGMEALITKVLHSRGRTWALAVYACGAFLLIMPLYSVLSQTPAYLETDIRSIDQVVGLTAPDDRVLDCWTGLYLTRLPAYRYFFLNSDVQRLLSPEKLEQDLLDRLRDPKVKVVIRDRYFERLPLPVITQVEKQFAPLPDFPFLWVRRR
jgi:4-amino-4-deoxy-L-arabinose transferase-like glycosyltransferase